MKSRTKKILSVLVSVLIVLALSVFIGYKGFYTKVYNQSNTKQDMEIGGNVDSLTIEAIVRDMYGFPNRFAGTKSNALAVQYIRNYFQNAGLEPYFGGSFYHSFHSDWLKCSRYYILPVDGTVENVVGKIRGKDSSKAVVITAHMDSFLGKGVIDNASGASVLLETAKRLAARLDQRQYPIDIIFAACNAEESGLVGSAAFYEVLSKDYTQFYNINMDCVGVVEKPLAMQNRHQPSRELYQDILPVLEKHQIPWRDIPYAADEEGEPMGTSDHAVFQDHNRAALILGAAGIRGIPNTRKDKDMGMLDFPKMYRLADAVEDFIISSNGKIY